MTDAADVTASIRQLAESLASDAIGSIDHATNAKALALRSPLVVDKLMDLLSNGYRLKDITALSSVGASIRDFRLRFHFATDNAIDLPKSDFIVSVDLPIKSVKRIMSPSEAAESSVPPVPFALAAPSRANEVRTPISDMTNRFNRTRVFLDKLPIDRINKILDAEGYSRLLRSVDPYSRTDRDTVNRVIVDTPMNTPYDTYVETTAGMSSDLQPDVRDEIVADVDYQFYADDRIDDYLA